MTQLSATPEVARLSASLAPPAPALRAAVEHCRRFTRSHYENFSVASWFVPRSLRPHFWASYAYCRSADDLADGAANAADALRRLDEWETLLDGCYEGQPSHPVFVALQHTIREFGIPRQPFADLLSAFRQDQRVTRYATHDDVLGYCRGSANPVGRLILYVGRCCDERRAALADSICTGLQLANFCQDVARDGDLGRVYLPQATLDRAGYTAEMFARREFNDAFRRVMVEEVDRAADYLRGGEPLVGLMPKQLRRQVGLFVAGGLEILQAIRRQNYDVWMRRPVVSRWSQARLLWRGLIAPSAPRVAGDDS
ncbi:MAG: squalene synthase HpnC [Pirellulales bacterium]